VKIIIRWHSVKKLIIKKRDHCLLRNIGLLYSYRLNIPKQLDAQEAFEVPPGNLITRNAMSIQPTSVLLRGTRATSGGNYIPYVHVVAVSDAVGDKERCRCLWSISVRYMACRKVLGSLKTN